MKIIKIILFIGFCGFLLYNSIYIESLKKRQAAQEKKDFNPVAYAQKLYKKNKNNLLKQAIAYSSLLNKLKMNRKSVFNRYGHNEGISDSFYFLIKSKGTIETTSDSLGYIVINLSGMKHAKIHLKNSAIFGNAVIDATHWVSVNDFSNMMDYDNISNALNKLVAKNIKSSLTSKTNIGKTITFTGALKIDKNQKIDVSDPPEITPIEVNIVK